MLITGGAGFIGGTLGRRMASEGHEVVALDNLLQQVHGVDPLIDPAMNLVTADVCDVGAVMAAMEGVDVVHHLAAETGVGQSQYEVARYVRTNSYGTAVVLEAAVAARVAHVVIVSSRAVYGEGRHRCPSCGVGFVAGARRVVDMDSATWEVACPGCGGPGEAAPTAEHVAPAPTSIYGLTKLQQEQLAHSMSRIHGIPLTVLRLFNVFGPGQSMNNPYVGLLGTFFRRARAGTPIEVYEDGLMLRDFVFIDDVVEVLARCSGNPTAFGRTWNVGTGAAVTVREIAGAMFEVLGLEPDVYVSGRYRVGDVRHAVADVSALERDLGYRPATPFIDGLRRFASWAGDGPGDALDVAAEEQLADRQLLRRAAL